MIKTVHYLVVFFIELSQPASYFFWKSQPDSLAKSIGQNLQEVEIIRFYQELARVKNDFVAHLYFWLDQKSSSGLAAFTLSLGVWVYLHLNEVPGDLSMLLYTFTPTGSFTLWI